MPKLSRAETYQLWGLTEQHTISLGVMGTNPSVVAVSAQAPDAVGNIS